MFHFKVKECEDDFFVKFCSQEVLIWKKTLDGIEQIHNSMTLCYIAQSKSAFEVFRKLVYRTDCSPPVKECTQCTL